MLSLPHELHQIIANNLSFNDMLTYVSICRTIVGDRIRTIINLSNTHELIHRLCARGHTQMIQLIISIDNMLINHTHFMTACAHQHCDVIKLIMDQTGVDVTKDNAAWDIAIKNRLIETIQVLLQDYRFDPSVDNNWAISRATMYGHIELVKILLNNGVNPSVRNNFILLTASSLGHKNIVELLLADRRLCIGDDGPTAIANARTNGHRDIVELLSSDPRLNYDY